MTKKLTKRSQKKSYKKKTGRSSMKLKRGGGQIYEFEEVNTLVPQEPSQNATVNPNMFSITVMIKAPSKAAKKLGIEEQILKKNLVVHYSETMTVVSMFSNKNNSYKKTPVNLVDAATAYKNAYVKGTEHRLYNRTHIDQEELKTIIFNLLNLANPSVPLDPTSDEMSEA